MSLQCVHIYIYNHIQVIKQRLFDHLYMVVYLQVSQGYPEKLVSVVSFRNVAINGVHSALLHQMRRCFTESFNLGGM